MSEFAFQDGQTVVFIGDSITDCGRRDSQHPFGNGYVRQTIDPVLGRRVVRSRYGGARARAQIPGQVSDSRRGDHVCADDVDAARAEAGGERRFEHLARRPCVAADHHALAPASAQDGPRGASQGERQLGRQILICRSAHAVGSEQFTQWAGSFKLGGTGGAGRWIPRRRDPSL